jgi:alkylhydroperoxidase family enzyme
MAHQPPFNELPDGLDQLALDPKMRELSILRVLHRAHAHQACVERVADARRAGVSDEQIIAIQHPGTGPFSPRERLGLAFVDEVIRTPHSSDGLFEPMRSMFSEREIVELVLLVERYGTPGRQLAA